MLASLVQPDGLLKVLSFTGTKSMMVNRKEVSAKLIVVKQTNDMVADIFLSV